MLNRCCRTTRRASRQNAAGRLVKLLSCYRASFCRSCRMRLAHEFPLPHVHCRMPCEPSHIGYQICVPIDRTHRSGSVDARRADAPSSRTALGSPLRSSRLGRRGLRARPSSLAHIGNLGNIARGAARRPRRIGTSRVGSCVTSLRRARRNVCESTSCDEYGTCACCGLRLCSLL